ncbi:hypothetical protein BREVNS_1296 [Brevinematales bacterium NS]|nr:hypothetical protein BREVNS_1296 [Brevinematales bacterium NS]
MLPKVRKAKRYRDIFQMKKRLPSWKRKAPGEVFFGQRI